MIQKLLLTFVLGFLTSSFVYAEVVYSPASAASSNTAGKRSSKIYFDDDDDVDYQRHWLTDGRSYDSKSTFLDGTVGSSAVRKPRTLRMSGPARPKDPWFSVWRDERNPKKKSSSDFVQKPWAGSLPNDIYARSRGSWGQSYLDLWGLEKIGLNSSVWNSYKGEGIKIAIVDTGVNYFHEDIQSNIWFNQREWEGRPGVDDDRNGYVDDVSGWDFVNNDNFAMDEPGQGHGSHVAGIAAGVGNNSKGIVGVAPLAKVIPVRVLGHRGGAWDWVAKGIEYAAKMGANIINLSLGGIGDATSASLLQKAVDYAFSRGAIVVAAAGNSASDVNNFSPANLNNVIAVGATDANDAQASFSNFGSKLFITAPGVEILSLGSPGFGTTLTSNYARASGTSMAAPFVSGAIALLLNKYPGASLSFIKERLTLGTKDLGTPGRDDNFGVGRLNIAASLGISSTQMAQASSTSTMSSALSQKTTAASKNAPKKKTSTSSSVQMAAMGEIFSKQAVLEQQYMERKEITDNNATLVPELSHRKKEAFDSLQ